MKKLSLLLMIMLFSFVSIGCSSDDEPDAAVNGEEYIDTDNHSESSELEIDVCPIEPEVEASDC
jgi:uncharacterized protein YcfL